METGIESILTLFSEITPNVGHWSHCTSEYCQEEGGECGEERGGGARRGVLAQMHLTHLPRWEFLSDLRRLVLPTAKRKPEAKP